MKYLLFLTFCFIGGYTSFPTVIDPNSISSKKDLLSIEQINFLNQSELPRFGNFKKISVPSNMDEYLLPPMLNGKVTIDTEQKGRSVETIFVYKNSLLVELTQHKHTSKIGYDEQNRVTKVGSRDYSYDKDGLLNKFQIGSRSTEYIRENNCITEIFIDERDKIETNKSYCYNKDGQIVRDSTLHKVSANGKYLPVGTMCYSPLNNPTRLRINFCNYVNENHQKRDEEVHQERKA